MWDLLLVLVTSIIIATLLGSLGLLPPHTTGATSTEWRSKGEVNVLLGVEADDEGGDVDDLLADADVALADQDTGVVDGLGEAELVDTGLETALQEILNLEGKHVIKLHAGLIEHTKTDQTTNEGIAFEETLGVLLVEGEELTGNNCQYGLLCERDDKNIPGSTTDLGEGELDTPDLTLVAETVLADDLQLGVTVPALGWYR